MKRKFLTPDGDVLEETEWAIKPMDRCFYCDQPLESIINEEFDPCWDSQDMNHDWITLVNPSDRR